MLFRFARRCSLASMGRARLSTRVEEPRERSLNVICKESLAFKNLVALAFGGDSNGAFESYNRWLSEHREHVESGRRQACEVNGASIGMLLVSLHVGVNKMSLKQFFANDGNGGAHWLDVRLAAIERFIEEHNIRMPWDAFRALLTLEAALHSLRRGRDGAAIRSPKLPKLAKLAKVGHHNANVLDSSRVDALDAMIERVSRLEVDLMARHGKEVDDLFRDGDKTFAELMKIVQAKGHGIEAVMLVYESILREGDNDFASTKLNATLLRLALAEMDEVMGAWHHSEPSIWLRRRMPDGFAAQLGRLLDVVSTMRNVDAKTFKCALIVAYALNDAEALARVLGAFEHNKDVLNYRVMYWVAEMCSSLQPRNGVAVVDQVWRQALQTRSTMKLSPAIVGKTMTFYRRAGAIDKVIDVYEQSINEFGVQVDARNVAVLMHSVVSDGAAHKPSVEQQRRALALAEHSGFIDHKYVEPLISKVSID
jgi:hypothetical protein